MKDLPFSTHNNNITLRGGARIGSWNWVFLNLWSWILKKKSIDFGFSKICWICISDKFYLRFWILKKYHWILDIYTKIRLISDFVRFLGFSLDLDISNNYYWILDFGQKSLDTWIQGPRSSALKYGFVQAWSNPVIRSLKYNNLWSGIFQ